MNVLSEIDMNLFSACICLVLYLSIRGRNENGMRGYRFITRLLVLNVVMLTLDAYIRVLAGIPGWLFHVSLSVAAILYSLCIPVAFFCMSFSVCAVYYKKLVNHGFSLAVFLLPLLVICVLDVVNLFTPRLFFIDAYNRLILGGFVVPYLLTCTIYPVIGLWMGILHFQRTGNMRELALAVYFLVQIFGVAVTIAFLKKIPCSSLLILALLILYFYMETDILYTDHLTGIYNRLKLDRYISRKIHLLHSGRARMPFCGFMLDINNFKDINDRFGHSVGDEALQMTAKVLRLCLAKSDFLARLGGDEFVIIKDVAGKSEMLKLAACIDARFNLYNTHSSRPYELSLSLGYDLYPKNGRMSKDAFIMHIDSLMYQNKKFRKQIFSKSYGCLS